MVLFLERCVLTDYILNVKGPNATKALIRLQFTNYMYLDTELTRQIGHLKCEKKKGKLTVTNNGIVHLPVTQDDVENYKAITFEVHCGSVRVLLTFETLFKHFYM